MKIESTIEVLEALVSGCSPQTGELIDNDSVLNERNVIRALERAIFELERINHSNQRSFENSESKINEEEIEKTIRIYERL